MSFDGACCAVGRVLLYYMSCKSCVCVGCYSRTAVSSSTLALLREGNHQCVRGNTLHETRTMVDISAPRRRLQDLVPEPNFFGNLVNLC